MFKKLVVAMFVIIASLSSIAVFAQESNSNFSGQITDSKGVALPSTVISIKHVPTGFETKTQSNNKGYFYIPNLPVGGPYTIVFSFVGKKSETKTDYNLSLGTNSLNVKMNDQSATLADVTVTTKRAMGLKTGAGVQIGQSQIRIMPTINRSLQDVTRITPQSNNNSFAGTNFRYNNVTIDGAINNDAIGFSPSLGGQTNSSGMAGSSTRTNPVSLDAIQDVQVYLAPFDVKIGNFLGGSINAVTRSGTNEFHGSIYGFGRGAFMVGPNNAGDKAKLPSDFYDYQTGVRFGFPMIKGKLFFFTNEEITRRQDPVILGAGSADNTIISAAQAYSIDSLMKTKYGLEEGAGTYGNTSIYSKSNKFFNRLDWIINANNRLSIRNNTITSEATNLERDGANFRFGSIDFKQINNQTSTVLELKTKFNNTVSNSLILGYSNINDYREPVSNSALPQIEISSNGGTIFLGSDREASIFNMKQKTNEFTDNVTVNKGIHTFTLGTHNEFYDITYGFVNAWNGRVAYRNVGEFLAGKPQRVRTNYNYSNNTRDNIMANPPAQFKVNLLSFYAQDEIRLGRLKITPGIRFDYSDMPNKQPLSTKTTNAPVDVNYGTTYNYTLPKNITNNFLGKVQISPRLGFNYDVKGDQTFVIRGGAGVFTGRIPFAWMGYAYYNNGVTYGAYDRNNIQSGPNPIVAGTDPIADALNGKNGEANFVAKQGVNINDASGPTQVDLIDNDFKMPQALRTNLAIDYITQNKWKFTVEAIYTKVIYDLKFQQINLVDKPTYWIYDTKKQQPIYSNTKINSLFTNAYLLSNTKDGNRYSITGQVSKTFDFGLNFTFAYTYGQSKDITNGIRNSMESNWQLNQSLTPNNPQLAYSNFDVRNRIVSTANYRTESKNGKFVSTFSLFYSAASGAPYTYGLVNATNNGTPQTQGLVYIPTKGELSNFFNDATQAAAFDAFVDGNKYLNSRRGDFTERNAARTPWNNQLDFRFTQDYNIKNKAGKTNTITFNIDVINLTNLLNPNWGKVYFSPNTFNSTSSLGLTRVTAGSPTVYPKYTWVNPGLPYVIDYFGSRYQINAGIRYTF
ncbi:MAG: carboxypeptidase regulatory-like domain-containing protein [Deinococcales bacterium]|nr:carboxypeptidase regulatory-like domain-containing protein [Chitinophagaceae bacterium]